jgi:TPR repeat protein
LNIKKYKEAKKMADYKELSSGELQRLASSGDREAYYWLGDDYYKRGDYQNTAVWWEKVVKELPSSHECFKRAACNLSLLHQDKLISQADDNEAIRLYELVPNLGPISILALGLLYCEVQGQKHDVSKGIGLVEKAIQSLIKEDGDDEYLKYAECFRIARMYYKEVGNTQNVKYLEKAFSYAAKTVKRGPGTQHANAAQSIIDECERIMG